MSKPHHLRDVIESCCFRDDRPRLQRASVPVGDPVGCRADMTVQQRVLEVMQSGAAMTAGHIAGRAALLASDSEHHNHGADVERALLALQIAGRVVKALRFSPRAEEGGAGGVTWHWVRTDIGEESVGGP